MEGYVESYYTSTVVESVRAEQSLEASITTDVCVIGGGLAGIATALGLLDRGRKVVVLEKGKIGGAASGMNGGFVIPGFAVEGEELIDLVGEKRARLMYGWTLDALTLMKERVKKNAIKCDLEHTGMVTLSYFKGRAHDAMHEVDLVNSVLGTECVFWPVEKVRAMYKSKSYYHGLYDPVVHTVHPLNLTLGLARVATEQGARVFENTRAANIAPTSHPQLRWRVETESLNGKRGAVDAHDVVITGGSILDTGVDKQLAQALVPVLTYIMLV